MTKRALVFLGAFSCSCVPGVPDDPIDPTTFVHGALDLCVSTDIQPGEGEAGRDADVLAFTGTVVAVDAAPLRFGMGNCRDDARVGALLEPESGGPSPIRYHLALALLQPDGETETLFSPDVGDVLELKTATANLRLGTKQMVVRRDGERVFAATDLTGELFADEAAEFGFSVSTSLTEPNVSVTSECGTQSERSLILECAQSVSEPVGVGQSADACGWRFHNVSSYEATSPWACSDLINPTAWYAVPSAQ